jgi:HEPN domain-containing protein
MPPDPVRSEEAKSWLAFAQKDLRRMDILLDASPTDAEGILFFCQQATEKALKAFLLWNDVPFRKTHNLDEIGGQCVALDGSLSALTIKAGALTAFGAALRYPGAPYIPDADEVESAMATAREVFNAVLARVPADARP